MKTQFLFFVLTALLVFSQNVYATYTYTGPGTVIVHSPKSDSIYRGTPSIIKIWDKLYASNDVFGPGVNGNRTELFVSIDNGVSWSQITSATVSGAVWSGLFSYNDSLFLMGGDSGNGGRFVIRKYNKTSNTWSAPTVILNGACHGSATPVVIHNGYIYKCYEHTDSSNDNGKWMSATKAYFLKGRLITGIMNQSSWTNTVSSEIAKPEWIDGSGWLETNAVLGPDNKIKCIARLASTEGIYAGIYSLNDDNTTVDESSKGKIQFWGGASKFTIRKNPATGRYWSLVNYVPAQYKYNNRSAGGTRCVLALTYSDNLTKWYIKSIILADNRLDDVGFQYVDWQFDEDDIIFASRTAYDDGLGGAMNFHNSNFMTFHRISNYASVTTPPIWQELLPSGWDGEVLAFDDTGSKGSSSTDPILISHPGQLVYLSEKVYQGNSFSGKYFKLVNDIDLNQFNFLPIGWYITTSENKPFSGIFNGAGFCIKNFKIRRNDDDYSSNGVFGYMLGGSVINLGMASNDSILVGGISGGIVGVANGTVIKNCYNKGFVTGTSHAGGIVAYGVGAPVLSNCYNTGNISLSSLDSINYQNEFVGGIMGFYNTGTLSNCYSTGNVTIPYVPQSTNRGGVVGTKNKSIPYCYYTRGDLPANGSGAKITLAQLKDSVYLSYLNTNQIPIVWKTDYVPNINNGYPVLFWDSNPWDGVSLCAFDTSNYRGVSQSNPILIQSTSHLAYLSQQTNLGNTFLNKYFKLTTDLDLNNKDWTPIGWYITTTNNNFFKGHFDGDGHFVKNIKVTTTNSGNSSGLFGAICNGSIANIGISGNISWGANVGGIVGVVHSSSISSCYNAASIKGSAYVGGVVGIAVKASGSNVLPTISDCYNTGIIELNNGTNITNRAVGGLIGYATAELTNSYNVGNVSVLGTGISTKGGVVGNGGTVQLTRCYYKSGTINGGNSFGTEKTDSYMKTDSFVTDLNYLNRNVWCSDSSDSKNNGYPIQALDTQNDMPKYVHTNNSNISFELGKNELNKVMLLSNTSLVLFEPGKLVLIIYNSSGQEISIVYNQTLDKGYHSFQSNIDNLDKGLYIICAHFNGRLIKTKKIVINK